MKNMFIANIFKLLRSNSLNRNLKIKTQMKTIILRIKIMKINHKIPRMKKMKTMMIMKMKTKNMMKMMIIKNLIQGGRR